MNARFSANGNQVVYDAALNGKPSRLFVTTIASRETRDLGFEKAHLATVSPAGEMVALRWSNNHQRMTLEAMPVNGGAPHPLPFDAHGADFSSNGILGLITSKDQSYTVEFPPGKTIYRSAALLNDLRVSPRGDQVALLEHPIPNDDAGRVLLLNSNGKARVLSDGWESIDGLAWHPSGREIWFTAARFGVDPGLMAVDLKGRTRQIAQVPGGLLLRDINASGNVLVARANSRLSMFHGDLNQSSVTDISWLDWSSATAISADGKHVLFDESGQGGGMRYSVYLYNLETRSAERLGDGRAVDLSADGQWALTENATNLAEIYLISLKDRKAKQVSNHGFQYQWARFLPSSCSEILFKGGYPGKLPQLYKQSLPDGVPVPILLAQSLGGLIIDQTGRYVAGLTDQFDIALVDLHTGQAHSISNPKHAELAAFANDRQIITSREDNGLIVLELLELGTGEVRLYHRVEPVDRVGTVEILPLHLARDLHTFVYSRLQSFSTLFVVTGWR